MIAHTVRPQVRFPSSLRVVGEVRPERGIMRTDETVRRWAIDRHPHRIRGFAVWKSAACISA
jgi:transposase-like protein